MKTSFKILLFTIIGTNIPLFCQEERECQIIRNDLQQIIQQYCHQRSSACQGEICHYLNMIGTTASVKMAKEYKSRFGWQSDCRPPYTPEEKLYFTIRHNTQHIAGQYCQQRSSACKAMLCQYLNGIGTPIATRVAQELKSQLGWQGDC